MKILIIGGCGFIGKHLVDHYNEVENTEVYVADVLMNYHRANYYFNIGSQNDFYSIFSKNEFDACINASGAANVSFSLKQPGKDFQLNTVNVFNILDAIRLSGFRTKFLNLSSAAVYGNPVSLPMPETAELKPVSPYGWHKLKSELICKEFNQCFGIPTSIARIFSAYGEGLEKQLFWDIHKKIKETGHLTLFGTGKESRDFIYIKDLVSALHSILSHSPFEADVYNVASGVEVAISECANIFSGFYEQEISVEFSGEDKKGDPKNWLADISKLKGLNFEPSFSMEKGLHNYYKWLKSWK